MEAQAVRLGIGCEPSQRIGHDDDPPAAIERVDVGDPARDRGGARPAPPPSPPLSRIARLIDYPIAQQWFGGRGVSRFQVWMILVRPSRRPLRGLLRMRFFLNPIKSLPHPEVRPPGTSRRTHNHWRVRCVIRADAPYFDISRNIA